MRKVFSVALMAAVVCLIGMTRDASATVTITLVWETCAGGVSCTGVGTNTLVVDGAGGQTARLGIYLTHDEVDGIKGHSVSLAFDTDLANELNVTTGTMATNEWSGTDVDAGLGGATYSPLLGGLSGITESGTGGPAGRLNSFESGSTGGVLPRNGFEYFVGTTSTGETAPGSYRIGFAQFLVNAGSATDGDDIFSGLFNINVDGLLDDTGAGTSVGSFGNAAVNLVPEPGTVSLLGLGLIGLVLAGRRRS
jgi:hypothetical protein